MCLKNMPRYKIFFKVFLSMQTSTNIKKSKIIAIVSLGLGTLLGWVPMFGIFLKIAAWVLMIVAASNLAKVSKSPSLLRSCILMCLCAIFSELHGIFLFLLGPLGLGSLIAVSLVMAFTIGNIYFAYKYYKEMRSISGVSLFFHCVVCRAIGVMLIFLSHASIGIFGLKNTAIGEWLLIISVIFYYISLILELVAWITLKEVKIFGADFIQAETALANASPPKTE